jgi:hypothetical protein
MGGARLPGRKWTGRTSRGVVINARMNKRGMRWKWANATAIVALRVQRINTAWETAAA